MLRPARLVTMVLIAMFVVAVPSAVAASPVTDQYAAPLGSDTAASDAAGATGNNVAPVQPRQLSAKQAEGLPFTGGQISLIALVGLGLLALGATGLASTRRRGSTAST